MISVATRLHVGPVAVALSGKHGSGVIHYSDWPYREFLTPPPEGPLRPRRCLRVLVQSSPPAPPARPPDYAAGRNWALWREGATRVLATGWLARPVPRSLCRLDARLTHAELFVEGDPADAPLRYPLDQVLSWGLLASCGAVLVHAAAVERDGVGVLLVGRSGAGKSTLAALCAEEGWDILNDDRAIAFRTGGRWRLAGTPWHGSGRFARNRTAALGAVCLLQQDSRDALEELSAAQARLALLETVSVPWFEEEWSQGALNAVAALAAGSPCYRFGFTRNLSAVRALDALIAR